MNTVEILNELNSLPGQFAITDSAIARRFDVEPKTIIRWRKGGERLQEVTRCALAYVLLEQRAAMDAVLAGRPADPAQKPSIGCNIKWRPGSEPSYFK